MKEFLPSYGKEALKVETEEEHLASALVPEFHDHKTSMEEGRLVQETLGHPIGTPRLCDMAIDKKKVVIISSDHTRPAPSYIIMPFILEGIHRGNPDAEITILMSTGLYRKTTRGELGPKLDPEITKSETIIVYDCGDTDNMVCPSKLPSSRNLYISKLAVEADLLVAERFIEPHFLAGFSGDRKSVLPGVASRRAIMYNHSSTFIDDFHSRIDIIEDNPVHNDMLYAARMAGLDFIVDVVIGPAHESIFAIVGDYDLTHRVGGEFLAFKCQVDVVPADIVISTNGGHPLDQGIYQSAEDITAAKATVKEGGVIIVLSKVADGHGGKYSHRTFRDEKGLNHMMKTSTDRKPEETIIDQQQSQIFAKVTLKARIVLTSSRSDGLVEELHMISAHTMEEAPEGAKAMVDKKDYKVTVIPDGVSVIVRG